jgi:hypothetical protein
MVDIPSSLSNTTSVLDGLSFEAGDNTNITTMDHHHNRPIRMQGVLWKRRDVFRNRWRPRWFVIHPDQNILTYYLLTSQEGGGPQQVSSSGRTTNNRSNSGNSINNGISRRRTYSESSNISENTVDYDVVPRGTIYLLGSTVEANEVLTRAEEELFVLSITDHENATHVHLAARTPESRTEWINQIRAVCQSTSSTTAASSSRHRPPRARATQNSDTLYTTPPRSSTTNRAHRNGTTMSPSTPLYNQTLLESPSMLSQGTTDNSVTAVTGWNILYTDTLFENVPLDLKGQMEDVLLTHLPHVEDVNHPEWKLRYNSNGIHCSVRRDGAGKPMIRSIRQGTPNHHPVEYLQLVWDLSTAVEYEANVHSQSLLKSYNTNASLVYKAYQPVWPTSPRDFATAAFWTLLQRQSSEDRAICVVAFSCHEAEEEMDSIDNAAYVRGTLNVALNFWTLKTDGCFHTRIVSFQLNGHIPPSLTQTIMEQQANMPRVMDTYLTKLKQNSSRIQQRRQYKLEYQAIYEALNQMSTSALAGGIASAITESKYLSSMSVQHALLSSPTVKKEAVVLLTPLLLYKLLSLFSIRCSSLFLVVAIACAVQYTISEHLLTVYRQLSRRHHPKKQNVLIKGSTCCRFTVDLKGVLRFLANEKEAGEDETLATSNEILISHILVRALGQAMCQLSHLTVRQYPLLPPLYAVDVVFHDHKNGKSVWVDRADEMTVQEIADYFTSDAATVPKSFWQTAIGPTCHVFASPDSDHGQVDLDVKLEGVPITVCVSGIRLEKENRQPNLSVAITIQSTDVDDCRAFAETVQKLIQFPEMLE